MSVKTNAVLVCTLSLLLSARTNGHGHHQGHFEQDKLTALLNRRFLAISEE